MVVCGNGYKRAAPSIYVVQTPKFVHLFYAPKVPLI